jgi:hypothetical protein
MRVSIVPDPLRDSNCSLNSRELVWLDEFDAATLTGEKPTARLVRALAIRISSCEIVRNGNRTLIENS